MMERRTQIANASKARTLAALNILFSSTSKFLPYDPARTYTPEEREYYDALCDRFLRAVEASLKFFRSYELMLFGENSESLRDLLNRMHKAGLISGAMQWFDMRELRNRIAHDYLPEQLQDLYRRIHAAALSDLQNLQKSLLTLELRENRSGTSSTADG